MAIRVIRAGLRRSRCAPDGGIVYRCPVGGLNGEADVRGQPEEARRGEGRSQSMRRPAVQQAGRERLKDGHLKPPQLLYLLLLVVERMHDLHSASDSSYHDDPQCLPVPESSVFHLLYPYTSCIHASGPPSLPPIK